ncbi:MAG TPA: tetratricopeptide repeat protein [Rhodanobacteraceae bacterium]
MSARVDGFFDRLRQRKIVQWTLAYLAGAFALLQATDLIGQRFGFPDIVVRVLIVALAVGFFAALVLAWYHGERGEQRVGGIEISLLALLLAIGGGLLWRVAVSNRAADVSSANAAGDAAPSLGAASTAVLPFVNMSPDKANEYFSDGMTETLLNRLAQVPELKVAARTSSFSFKGTNTDVRRIAAALGVASIVEGSVQQSGGTLRITAQLIRAVDGTHLWSQNYDRKSADLFAIQDEIAAAVTQALIGELLPKTKAILAKGGTKDLAAYDAYTRGLQQIAINSIPSLRKAEGLMQQALALDPQYVDAMVGVAVSDLALMRTGGIVPAELRARVVPVLERIEAIDPGNATALAIRGEIADELGEHDEAVRLARRAAETAPGVAWVHVILGTIYSKQGDVEAMQSALDHAVALNPLDANLVRFRASSLQQAGRLDEARTEVLRAVDLDPKNSSNYWELSLLDYAKGDLVSAVVNSNKGYVLDPEDSESPAVSALFLGELGEIDAAAAWIPESERIAPGNIHAAGAAVSVAFDRGDMRAAVDAAMRLVSRRAEERHDFWHNAITSGCLAASQLGRYAEFRTALEDAGALPRDFSAPGFAAWLGPKASAKVQLRVIAGIRRCAFDESAADATRRAELLALMAATFGSGWDTKDEWRSLAAELRGDRDAMIAESVPPRQTTVADLPVRTASARFLGIADEARVAAHLAEQRGAIERMRAELPGVLAKEGVPLRPALVAGAKAAPAAGSGPE